MKPHQRIRKTIKWGGAAVTVLLVVVWIGSGWYSRFAYLGKGVVGGWDRGRLHAVYLGADLTAADLRDVVQTMTEHHAFSFDWWFDSLTGPLGWTTGWAMWVPTWVVVIPLAAATAMAWRLDALARRRVRLGKCPKCNYDRAGIGADAVCPECGKPGCSP